MNVILDANILGIGFYHKLSRTGISRVVEHLMTGLQQSSEVNLFLAAYTHLPETMRYAQAMFGVDAPLFVNAPGEQAVARLENGLLGVFSPKSLPTKVIRAIDYRTRRALNREQARFDLNRLPDSAVYHAPFFPSPPAIRTSKVVSVVQTIHDLIPILHPEWFNKGEQTVRQVLDTLPANAWITTISQATKDDFCSYTGFDSERVVPILPAASPALFHPVADESRKGTIRARLGVGDAPYLLSVATLEPRKNVAHLIRCFGTLVDSGELPAAVKLVLVGTKGWKFDDVLAEAGRSPALKSQLVFTGFVPDEELAALYSSALAFVYPSLYEGFGLPPLEAMQCGLPVITSTIPAIAEVVGDAAIRVAPTDADALCQAMLTLVNDSSTRAELSVKSLKRAGLFSWDKFITEHVALYKRVRS